MNRMCGVWCVGNIGLSKESMETCFFFFFQAEDGIRDIGVTGVQTCALPILRLTMFCLGESVRTVNLFLEKAS